ncbi:MAG: ribosome maturation factor RimP [Campylobacterales bacterium]|nr:ribosome maturation factor RimP [Campylobacterales bacterium]
MRNEIRDSIAKIVGSFGAKLYDIEIVTEFEDTILRVMIVKEVGVTLDLCADISRELSLFLDVNPPMEQAYRLEVSSPGIERKLTKPYHFQNSLNEKVKLKIADEGQVVGVLKSADENGIVVDIDGVEKTINYSQINKARTYFEW